MDVPSQNEFYRNHGLITEERLGYFLESCAAMWPAHELICQEGTRYTYDEIHRWSIAVARQLVDLGVKRGDSVLVQGGNSIALLAMQFAVWRIGAVCAPVLPIYRQHEVMAIASEIRPTAFAADGNYRGRDLHAELDEIAAESGVQPVARIALNCDHPREGWTAVASCPGSACDDTGLPEPLPSGECAVILFTSGTTSRPKAAMLSGAGILSQARSLAKFFGLSHQSDATLLGSPLAHTAALSYGVLMPMAVGARTVVLSQWNPADAARIIDAERVTIMSAPVVFLYDLVDFYEKASPDIWRLRVYNSGGGVNPPSLIRRADALGLKATRSYGMTEVCGGATLTSPNDPLEKRAHHDGRAVFGAKVEIVDEQHRPVPHGTVGEIRLQSPQLMLRYLDEKQSAQAIDEDRWFYTGDLGTLDEDGWLTVSGRIKDIINRGGEKFSASDIEAALTTHPVIAEAAVVGAPDERFGEIVAAAIKIRQGESWNGPDDVLRHLEKMKVAKQKFPVRWMVMEDLPKTATGKVHKETVRQAFSRPETLQV